MLVLPARNEYQASRHSEKVAMAGRDSRACQAMFNMQANCGLLPMLPSQALLGMLCVQGAAGAPLLVQSFAAGGDEARRAYATRLDLQCPDDDTGQAILDAFNVVFRTKEFNDPTTGWT